MIVLVVVPNYWGKGKTLDEAIKNVKKAGASSVARRVVVVTTDDGAKVDPIDGSVLTVPGSESLVIERKG